MAGCWGLSCPPTAVSLSGFSLCPGPLDTAMSQMVKSEEKGAKRKAPEGERNGSEELVEKKVCKGFHTA